MSEAGEDVTPEPEEQPAAFTLSSVCECQALLSAELGEDRLVLRGWAARRGAREPAPANTIGEPADRFDVAWHCPLCGRNTLRSFHEGALVAV